MVRNMYDKPAIYEVELEYDVDMVTITVKDYGKGFDVKGLPVSTHGAQQNGRYGISFMNQESSVCTILSSPRNRTTARMETQVTYRDKRVASKFEELSFL